MADKIKLVQGDNLPYIKLALTDVDGSPLDVSGATVVVYFRAVGSDTVLSTLTCSNVNTGTDGLVRFNFPGTTLNVEPGNYEGEVEASFGGLKQTVYDTLKFQVRKQFS